MAASQAQGWIFHGSNCYPISFIMPPHIPVPISKSHWTKTTHKEHEKHDLHSLVNYLHKNWHHNWLIKMDLFRHGKVSILPMTHFDDSKNSANIISYFYSLAGIVVRIPWHGRWMSLYYFLRDSHYCLIIAITDRLNVRLAKFSSLHQNTVEVIWFFVEIMKIRFKSVKLQMFKIMISNI